MQFDPRSGGMPSLHVLPVDLHGKNVRIRENTCRNT